ncbi:hypothetical protein ACS0TY_010715 [Phlomoides rotata]
MSNRRERTLQDLCDATLALSQAEITPILRGNFRMQGPTDEANCNLTTHMVTAENNKGFSSCSNRSQKFDCKEKSGTCNVCSAPCSSCFHANKVLVESNDESAGETCAGNIETGQLSVLSTVGGMDSTSESFSGNAAKACSKFSNACVSDDSVVHSKSESRRSPEGHDDCLSCVSGTDEHANRKYETADSGINYKQDISGCISGKVSPSNSQTGIHSQKTGAVGRSSTLNTDDATVSLKVQATSQAPNEEYLSHDLNQRDVKDDKPSDTKDELLKSSTAHLNPSSPSGMTSDVACGNPPAADLDPTEKNDDMDVENHAADGTDDSDMVEQDVKVCDICGDAGREDLLAVCSRCSDGAEHTYCMREMLEKVPEGDWLCEECKALEQVEKRRQEKIGRVDKNEKNNSSGQASENLNSSDVEDRRTKSSTKVAPKRLRDDDDAEVSSIIKKPALESIVGSPKTSNSSKIAALSRESSFKNLDRGKLQPPHHSSSETVPINGTAESAKSASDPRLHNFRGTFSKSNSFSSLNSKPKVKLVEQVAIQRQKSAKESSSFRHKDGAIRSIGKSISFKSTNPSRSESKTKMLSPRLSHMQDVKDTKERSTFERQRSFRTEHPSNNSMMGPSMNSTSRIDKRPTSRVESSSLTTIANQHEVKPVQTDSKTAALSRSSSLSARRTADISSSIGLPDGLSRPKDLTDSGDRMRDYSGSRVGPPSVKSSRDDSDNLKAAIEAAVLKKPGVYRKHRASGQSDESSMPTVAGEVVSHQDHISSAIKKKTSSDVELPERPSALRNLNAESLKEEALNIVKKSSLVHVEGLSSGGRDGAHIALYPRDTFRNVPAVMPLMLKSLAIPEHEYIWQGSFEICRSGQIFNLWDGIQAHLSTCASPKVMEAVNKFKSRIVLYEVPRLSTWPVQFQENGVREDDIAIFFFAKDFESHIKIYKVLLDNMMKNDLALKGNIDGVELLIFPSNLLPDNLKRWNMLFYLWGVLRGKKESCLQQMPESVNQYCTPQDIPQPIMSLPENRCSLRPITENVSEDANPLVEVPASEELRSLLTSRVVNRDCNTGGSSLVQLEHGLNSSSSFAIRSDGVKQCQEMRGTNQEGEISSSYSPLSGREQMSMQFDATLNRLQSPHDSSKSVGLPEASTSKGTTTLDETCNQNEVKKIIDARDLSTNGETPLDDAQITRDLNIEPSQWLFSHRESMHPGLPVAVVPYAGPSLVSPIIPIYNEPCGALERMNHVPSENPERRFFPVELPPPATESMPWKTHLLAEDDKAPNLELALGAETPPLTLGIEPLLINKVDQKVNEERILEEEAGGSKAEDDVSASLSLSLAFPFPEKDLNSKPAPKLSSLWLRGNG